MEAYERNVLHTLDADEFITIEDAKSAAVALNEGLDKAKNDLCVLVHQDVIFPAGWVIMLQDAIRGLDFGVCGVWGLTMDGVFAGNVIEPRGHWKQGELPVEAQSVDELIMIMRKSSGLRFDEVMDDWHFYGPDLCLEAIKRELKIYIIDTPVEHLSMGVINDGFYRAKGILADKWRGKSKLKCFKTTSADVYL